MVLEFIILRVKSMRFSTEMALLLSVVEKVLQSTIQFHSYKMIAICQGEMIY